MHFYLNMCLQLKCISDLLKWLERSDFKYGVFHVGDINASKSKESQDSDYLLVFHWLRTFGTHTYPERLKFI